MLGHDGINCVRLIMWKWVQMVSYNTVFLETWFIWSDTGVNAGVMIVNSLWHQKYNTTVYT